MTKAPRNWLESLLWIGLDVWIALGILGLIIFYG